MTIVLLVFVIIFCAELRYRARREYQELCTRLEALHREVTFGIQLEKGNQQ